MKKIWLKLCVALWSFSRGVFYRDLADAFRRKATLRDFLERELSNAKMVKDATRATVLQAIVNRYESGEALTLTALMSRLAPRSDQMLMAAVDDAPNKPEALEKAADAIDFQIRSLKVLLMNLAIPAICLPVVGAICLITAEIVALIATSAPPEIWEGFNGFVRVVADSINQYWPHMSVAIVAIITIIVIALPRWTGVVRIKVDNLPGFALYRDYNAAVVLSALAMMMSAKKPLVQSLEDLKANGSPWLKWHIQRILFALVDNPNDYSAAFARGLMPMSVRSRLATLMDSSSSFDAALITLGSAEVKRLEGNVKISAETLNWTLVGIMTSVAVLLSIGQMTIATSLSNATSPSKVIKSKAG
jgi:type II secretory pathway component PulF